MQILNISYSAERKQWIFAEVPTYLINGFSQESKRKKPKKSKNNGSCSCKHCNIQNELNQTNIGKFTKIQKKSKKSRRVCMSKIVAIHKNVDAGNITSKSYFCIGLGNEKSLLRNLRNFHAYFAFSLNVFAKFRMSCAQLRANAFLRERA